MYTIKSFKSKQINDKSVQNNIRENAEDFRIQNVYINILHKRNASGNLCKSF